MDAWSLRDARAASERLERNICVGVGTTFLLNSSVRLSSDGRLTRDSLVRWLREILSLLRDKDRLRGWSQDLLLMVLAILLLPFPLSLLDQKSFQDRERCGVLAYP